MLKFIISALRIIRTTIIFTILSCLVIFMVSNREIIKIQAYPLPFTIETRIFMVMIFFFLFGLAFGFLLFSQSMISRTIRGVKDRYKIKKLEKKVAKN